MLRVTSHRARRSRLTAMAVVSGTAGAVLVWSPGALAAAGCTTTTPSIGQTIMCNVAGTESITVPDGANAMEVVVIGGGGAGGAGASTTLGNTGGDGGAGAQVTATMRLPDGASIVTVTVGEGGSTSIFGGDGGDFSGLAVGSSLLVLAGGGGGGAAFNANATGGSGGLGGSAAGGNGEDGGNATGGAGGANNEGGAGGAGNDDGIDGKSFIPDGGSGGFTEGGSAGNGGAGYGGGGQGGSSANDNQGGGGAGGSYVNDLYQVGDPTYMPAVGPYGDGGAGGTGSDGLAGASGAVSITFFIRSTPSPASTTAAAAPATVLVFALPKGMKCNFNSVEASLGSWIELPGASDCTIAPRDGGEEPSLLGWATSPDFPVEIAERQVANGWGAYETYGDDGQLTGVFIPAGGYTVLSNDTNLYPIWS